MEACVQCETCGAVNRCEVQPLPETLRTERIPPRTQLCSSCGAPILVDNDAIVYRTA